MAIQQKASFLLQACNLNAEMTSHPNSKLAPNCKNVNKPAVIVLSFAGVWPLKCQGSPHCILTFALTKKILICLKKFKRALFSSAGTELIWSGRAM